MKNFFMMIMSCLVLSNIAYAEDKIVNTHDEVQIDELRREILNRTVTIQQDTGKRINIKQKFIVIGRSELLYVPRSMPKESVDYLNAICKKRNLDMQTLNDRSTLLVSRAIEGYALICGNNIGEKPINTLINTKKNEDGSIDEFYYDKYGRTYIKRKGEMVENGKRWAISADYLLLDDKRMMYIPNSASKETQQYRKQRCQAEGAVDNSDMGVSVMGRKNRLMTGSCIKESKVPQDAKIQSNSNPVTANAYSYCPSGVITGGSLSDGIVSAYSSQTVSGTLYIKGPASIISTLYFHDGIPDVGHDIILTSIPATISRWASAYLPTPGDYFATLMGDDWDCYYEENSTITAI